MDVFEKLEEIRRKPMEKKRRILFFGLTVSMALVIMLWIGVLKYQNRDQGAAANKGLNPWSVIKNTFRTSTEEFKKGLPGEVYLRGK